MVVEKEKLKEKEKETVTKPIRISESNYRRIQLLGTMGDTFDEVLTKILDEYNKLKKGGKLKK